MRAVVVYRSESEYGRTVEEFLRDFQYRTGRDLEIIDPDSRDGITFCSTYDVVEYPTVVALSDDGHMQSSWSGLPLPTISEVSYYA